MSRLSPATLASLADPTPPDPPAQPQDLFGMPDKAKLAERIRRFADQIESGNYIPQRIEQTRTTLPDDYVTDSLSISYVDLTQK